MQAIIDEIGNRYGKWVVISRAESFRRVHGARWLCRCDCGTECIVRGDSLRSGDSQSCGCLQRNHDIEKMAGQKFGRLVVIKRTHSDKWQNAAWLCECVCGNKVVVLGTTLRLGKTRSCGCLRGGLSLPEGEAAFNETLSGMRRSAKRRNYDWLLTKNQVRILTKQLCYYCGAEPSQGSSRLSPGGVYLYNGLDRINNAKGYTIDNVVPCCGSCNTAKSTKTVEEFKAWIRNVYEHFAKI